MRTFSFLAGFGAGAWIVRRAMRRIRAVDFSGASVVITGGGRGLGLELARCFAREGARLALLARNEDELAEAERELSRRGADVITLQCDVTDPQDVKQAVDTVVKRYGRVDVLVNNAGIIQAGPIEHMKREDYDQSLRTHFWGPYNMVERIVPHMRRQGRGRIVNITSIGGLVAVPHLAPYCVGKFGLVAFSDALRAELAKDGIRVTTVAPGLVRTGSHMNAYFKGRHRREFAWFSVSNALPLNSLSSAGTAELIVEACRYGDPFLVTTMPAHLLRMANVLAPDLLAGAMKLATRLLPGPTDRSGDDSRRGWESHSAVAPSVLTEPSDRMIEPNNEDEALEAVFGRD